MQPGANYNTKEFQKPLEQLKETGVDLQQFMEQHAKLSFNGVQQLIDTIAGGN